MREAAYAKTLLKAALRQMLSSQTAPGTDHCVGAKENESVPSGDLGVDHGFGSMAQ